MRARTSRRAALLVAVAALAASAFVTTGAGADHSIAPNDDRQWISQAGDGGGSSQAINEPQGLPVLEDMNVLSVLFHPKRFPFDNGIARPGFGRYVAFGLVRVNPSQLNDVIVSQLAISHSENGLGWSAPQPVTLRDPDGVDVPFILNEPRGFLDVIYTPESRYPAQFPFAQFAIVYRTLSSEPQATDAADLHIAWSDEGQTWYGDQSIEEDGANPVLAGGGFKQGSFGPTDLIYQTNDKLHPSVRPIAENANCATLDPDAGGPMVASPWNCRVVMLYDAIDPAGRHQVAIASSPTLGHPGDPENFEPPTPPSFRGTAAPLIPAGAATEWDDRAATLAKVRIRPNPLDARFPLYDLYYSGGTTPDTACFGNALGCWSFGSAISTGGLVFAKTGGNPVTPRELLELFGPDDPHTLWAPSVVDDAGPDGNGSVHARIYYSRITNGSGDVFPTRDMFLAYTEPAPTQAPRIRISEPQVIKSPLFPTPFRNQAGTPIIFTMTDTLGTPGSIGVDLTTLEVLIDGSPAGGGVSFLSPHLVNALKFPAIRGSIDAGQNMLADGLHTLSIEVADLEGNVGVATKTFIVDTLPPITELDVVPVDGRIGFPLSNAGTFTGVTTEPPPGTAIDRLDVTVTNPLGMRKSYEIRGALVNKVTPQMWEWAWVAPTPDLHFLLPGMYTFSFQAADVAQNREDVTEDNTISILLI
ncbi:MAG TPA: hypothetical protein VGB52_01670 [Actinomycetota bacterium]